MVEACCASFPLLGCIPSRQWHARARSNRALSAAIYNLITAVALGCVALFVRVPHSLLSALASQSTHNTRDIVDAHQSLLPPLYCIPDRIHTRHNNGSNSSGGGSGTKSKGKKGSKSSSDADVCSSLGDPLAGPKLKALRMVASYLTDGDAELSER